MIRQDAMRANISRSVQKKVYPKSRYDQLSKLQGGGSRGSTVRPVSRGGLNYAIGTIDVLEMRECAGKISRFKDKDVAKHLKDSMSGFN